ncbi:MAG: enterochelin esterase [Gammaproteobacteria bacterium]|nr:enterochelin esterase [Gammaproteobacteria bacterium]|tara:strand:+ start:53 stop:1150 length:1098 start_codon:yes stop_codon:yes gene_type:complete
MAIKRSNWPAGELVVLEHDSRILADNPLGDPHVRRFPVWLPPGYRPGSRGRRPPVLYDLTGYTGSGWAHTAWKNFEENVPERLARLLHERRMPACVVVFPDCFTALGGNQYVNSSAIGDYADYLVRELVPFVDAELDTGGERDRRGCFGKSSGGYGAIIHGMRHARTWGAVASHSGDAHFETCYQPMWPEALTHLGGYRKPAPKAGPVNVEKRAAGLDEGLDDGRVARFLDHFWQKERPGGDEIATLMMVAMAATYDPDPEAPNGFRLPCNLETGELIPARWRAWRRHDPVNLVRRHARSLKSLKGLWIDCGWRDQYHIHFGSRILSRELGRAGVKHTYEEFDGTHSGIDHRMDRSLPFLARALR